MIRRLFFLLLFVGAVTVFWVRVLPGRQEAPNHAEQLVDPRASITWKGQGRWTRARPEAGEATSSRSAADLEQQEIIERLEAIGYLAGVNEAHGVGGATLHDRDRAFAGNRLYISGHGPEALLIDIEGAVLHRWYFPIQAAWPDYDAGPPSKPQNFFRRVHLYENGDLLVIFEGYGIIKIDKDSNLVWERGNRAHHAIDVLDDGRVFVLTRTAHLIPELDPDQPKLEDFIVGLSPDGNEVFRLSVVDALKRSEYRSFLQATDARSPEWMLELQRSGDLYHTNALRIVRESHGEVSSLRKGNAILSCRHLAALLAVDLEAGEVVWFHRGDFVGQHEPSLLENGQLLLFDNGNHVEQSRVIQIDPRSGRILWEYPGETGVNFYSRDVGTAARLPNGNTQIVVTDMGVVYEVTQDGQLVWEFANPHRAGEDEELIASIFDMIPLPEAFPQSWAGRQP